MIRLVYGVGINDADYVVAINGTVDCIDGKRKRIWTCPFYQVWRSMLTRVYSEKCKSRQPTYKDCIVCDEWLTFSNFKAWMEKQPWKGKHLDKDILIRGNKAYSPETCVFVSGQVNTFLVDCAASRGEHMIGAYWEKSRSKFKACCSNPLTGKRETLGRFDSELEAHQAWLSRKLEHAYALAELQTDERVAKALVDRYTNYV